nr:type ISP restriction/modification enzyme [Helicobacter aurati]
MLDSLCDSSGDYSLASLPQNDKIQSASPQHDNPPLTPSAKGGGNLSCHSEVSLCQADSFSCHSEVLQKSEESHSIESQRDVSDSPQHDKVESCHSELLQKSEESQNLAQIYHYDLYGKRKDKYNFLYANSLDSIPWTKLKPKNPFYLFIPQNESLRAEYDKGWSVKDIFSVYSTGICSQRDSVVIHKTRESIETLIKDFCNKSKDEIVKKYNIQKDGRDWQIQRAIDSVKKSEQNKTGIVTKILYRPFDNYWTYFNGESRAFMSYPRTEVMQHFLQSENCALLVSRQSSAVGDDEINTIAITNKMVDINFYRRGGEQVMPLYLKNTESTKGKKIKPCHTEGEARSISQDSKRCLSLREFTSSRSRIANAQHDNPPPNPLRKGGGNNFCHSEGVRSTTEESHSMDSYRDSSVSTKLQNDNIESDSPHNEKPHWIENFTPEFRSFIDSKYNEHFSPEVILGYIYAVLFHKDYREKYIDFLKIDFPKIPFVESKEKFLALSALGQELIAVHLMDEARATSGIRHQASGIRHQASGIRHQASGIRHQASEGRIIMNCNIGLVCPRQISSRDFTHSFIAHTIMEMCYISNKTKEGNYLFPLYLYQKAK